MKASIIAVGTELLFGQTINTNATFLSKNLNLMGFDVMYHFVVGDNPNRLKDKIDEAFSDTDLIILTGGLGPTQDDLTKEIVAEYMGADMYRDEEVVKDLYEHFNKRGKKMAENNLKQAMLPVGCTPFYNASGTAPGLALEKNGKIAICLPGPPREMKFLWENFVREYLEQFVEKKMYYRILRTIGIGESDLETKLLPLIDGQSDPTIATYAKEGECTLRVASQRYTLDEAKVAVDNYIKKIDEICGEYIYSYDDEELAEVVVNLLTKNNIHLSSAESVTGGLFSNAIVNIPGASKAFDTSFITYSNESKVKNLDVDKNTIEKYGVSSKEVAIEMAIGALKKSNSDIAVSITGNAGPESYEGQEPGEAYIGWAYQGRNGCIEIKTNRYFRNWNRNYFTLQMIKIVYMLLRGEI